MSPSPTTPPSLIIPSNTLILLLPPSLFSPNLLPLFKAHFTTSYGVMVSWTALERLGRVLVVYENDESATEAKREMDGFVWEEEEEGERDGIDSSIIPEESGAPLRAFFGPPLSLPLPSLKQTLLQIPALSRNFLISPPGSPPVGWEQTLEEAPNRVERHVGDGEEEQGREGGWGEELSRALRFLSVSNGEEVEQEGQEEVKEASNEVPSTISTTTTILPAPLSTSTSATSTTLTPSPRPSVTLSTPSLPPPPPLTTTATPPPGAQRISSVKATISSMLTRRKSFGEIRSALRFEGAEGGKEGRKPTARPPVTGEGEYREE